MNDHHQNKDFCYYHPKQFLVGVCPFCLNEKLLIVAAKQSTNNNHHQNHQVGDHQTSHSRKPSNVIGLPNIFSFGSLLNRRRRHNNHNHQETYHDCDEDGVFSDCQSTSTSLEDSFISIKFEDNGVALWDKSQVSKASQDQANKPWDAATIAPSTLSTNHNKGLHKQGSWKSSSNRSVVEHLKTPRSSLRWRKRIGHLLQMVRGKRPNNASGGGTHVDGLGGAVKVRKKGWMRTLTRRRTYNE